MLVVLADKDPYDLEALRETLVAPDREVVTVPDGRNVIILAGARSPDAVVISASLGQMGGFAVCRQLKQMADLGEIRDPKVVVLLERDADAWVAAKYRCDAWRTKPVDPVDIDDLLRALVPNGTPARG